MINPFPFSDTNKRYYTWNYYVRNTFHKRVYKVALHANFTCPNRDGTCGVGGCTFCGDGSGEFAGDKAMDVLTQFQKGCEFARHKWNDCICIPYFQAYSNTYAPLSTLTSLFDPFAHDASIPMLCIATRCDCLSEETIRYLDDLSNNCEVWLELGLQSIFDDTAIRINRGHSFQQFVDCVQRLSKTKIKLCVHIMNSLPYESKDQMLSTIETIAPLPIHAVKIHMLHIKAHTQLHREYEKDAFPLLSKEEYIDIVVEQLERLPQHIVIQRLTGDGDKTTLIGPEWTKNKRVILNDIDKEMVKRNTYQGRL